MSLWRCAEGPPREPSLPPAAQPASSLASFWAVSVYASVVPEVTQRTGGTGPALEQLLIAVCWQSGGKSVTRGQILVPILPLSRNEAWSHLFNIPKHQISHLKGIIIQIYLKDLCEDQIILIANTHTELTPCQALSAFYICHLICKPPYYKVLILPSFYWKKKLRYIEDM